MIPRFSFHRSSTRRSGVAIVTVLAILVLVMGLVVALLNLAKTERKSASVFLVSEGLRQLGDSAVGIVQAQINTATTLGSGYVWASQPGMIRTYNSSADNLGKMDTAYKLYSASTMTTTLVSDLTGNSSAADYPSYDWASNPALWTDLNAPVKTDGTSAKVYPIVDPTVINSTLGAPEGFACSEAPGSTEDQTAPMPVRWLYVLQNGQIVAPTKAGSQITVAGASKTNPIKGRIAFWTDDESCKVNINTAGAGASGTNTKVTGSNGYWDTPRYSIPGDYALATSQPLNGEFQRYPGHPATTTLNAVFPNLEPQQILSTVTPRYVWGGSEMGAVDTVYTMKDALLKGVWPRNPFYQDVDEMIFRSSTTSRVRNDNFTRNTVEQARFFLSTHSQAPELNLWGLPRIACWPVHSSVMDDLNSDYVTPYDRLIARCASTGSMGSSTFFPYFFMRQNSLSSTEDATIPRNQKIFKYLQYLTGLAEPGFGGSNFSAKYSTDRDEILTEIWDYIRCTNLADPYLLQNKRGKAYTASASYYSGTVGTGYVVPLQFTNSIVPGATGICTGFGRTLTVTELAFIFICSADPVDKLLVLSGTPTVNGTTTQTGTASDGKVYTYVGTSDTNGFLGSNNTNYNSALGGTKLNWDERMVQMMIIPKFFSPSMGNIHIVPQNLRVIISGLKDLTLLGPNGAEPLFAPSVITSTNGGPVNSGSGSPTTTIPPTDSANRTLGDFAFDSTGLSTKSGGTFDYRAFISGAHSGQAGKDYAPKGSVSFESTPSTAATYPFISSFKRVKVSPTLNIYDLYNENTDVGTMNFGSSSGQITIYLVNTKDNKLLQKINIPVPNSTAVPIPNLVHWGTALDGTHGSSASEATNIGTWWSFSHDGACPGMPAVTKGTWASLAVDSTVDSRSMGRLYHVWAHPGWYGVSNTNAAVGISTEGAPYVAGPYGGTLIRGAQVGFFSSTARYTDVVRSIGLVHGDGRLTAAQSEVPLGAFSPINGWAPTLSSGNPEKNPYAMEHTLNSGYILSFYVPGCAKFRRHYVSQVISGKGLGGDLSDGAGGKYSADFRNDLDSRIYTALGGPSGSGSFDFDTPTSYWPDGAYINKPDEGNINIGGSKDVPYFQQIEENAANAQGYFSPNRMMPGPGMFGSLPTYIRRYNNTNKTGPNNPQNYAWRTLLFRNQPSHPDNLNVKWNGGGTLMTYPPDHLLMDLFWMPVVEPYAISESFATAGKINMNYQIQPFTYIQRATGMYAVLDREMLCAVSEAEFPLYKDPDYVATGGVSTHNYKIRFNLNPKETLKQFDNRFANTSGSSGARLFLSPSELCDMWLVPAGETLSSTPSFWNTHYITSDNMRERPYTTIIPRLTTKSNTFTVHYRVQTLKQVPTGRSSDASWQTWDETKDQVTGEYRGATTIQRFIDLNNSVFSTARGDFAISSASGLATPMDMYYRWRVISSKQFAP